MTVAGRRRDRMGNVRLAAGFAVMLAVVVGVRLVVVWLAGSSGPVRLAVSLVLVALFVGIPAVYGLRGLLRDDGAPDRPDQGG